MQQKTAPPIKAFTVPIKHSNPPSVHRVSSITAAHTHARTSKGMKCAACVYPNRGNVNGARSAPPPAFAFTFEIIYCSLKAARHLQPETHNCHASRSFTRRSPRCHVLMGQSRAEHKGITNTYGSSAGEGKADDSVTRPGAAAVNQAACQRDRNISATRQRRRSL